MICVMRSLLVLLAACGDNAVAIDAAPADAFVYTCNGITGLVAPLLPCSPAHPCGAITTPFELPECHTHYAGRPAFDDSPPRMWSDAVTGDARAACVYRPPGVGPRPLVLFVHGANTVGQSAAAIMYDVTSL